MMDDSWLHPWRAIDEVVVRQSLEDELRHEAAPRHLLHGIEAAAIARRVDCDDVLFESPDKRVADVHLTFKRETDPAWPWTEVYDTLQEFTVDRMASDHHEWQRRA